MSPRCPPALSHPPPPPGDWGAVCPGVRRGGSLKLPPLGGQRWPVPQGSAGSEQPRRGHRFPERPDLYFLTSCPPPSLLPDPGSAWLGGLHPPSPLCARAEGSSAGAAGEAQGFVFQAVGVAVWHNFSSPAFNFVIGARFVPSCCGGRAGRLGAHSATAATLRVEERERFFFEKGSCRREGNFLPTP